MRTSFTHRWGVIPMMRTFVPVLLVVVCSLVPAIARADDKEDQKEALQELQLFIGQWKGTASPFVAGRPSLKGAWTEKLSWGWKFGKKETYLTVELDGSKHFKKGELRYLLDDELYELTLFDKKDNKLIFKGKLKNNYVTLTRTDAKTKEVQEIRLNSAAEGDRFVYRYSHKPAGRTSFLRDYLVGATREGISLGGIAKKNQRECIMSGGLGTIAVSFKGQTFWVCCSGCRDEFNQDPEKYVKAFLKKKN